MVTPTRMGPSQGLSPPLLAASSSEASSFGTEETIGNDNTAATSPVLLEDDLYALPVNLYAVYRPLHWMARCAVAGISGSLALAWDGSRQSRLLQEAVRVLCTTSPGRALTQAMLVLSRVCAQADASSIWPWIKWTASFLLRTLVLATLATTVLQDVLVPPSRISSRDLAVDYHLPSPLSRWETRVIDNSTTTRLGLHWLDYRNETTWRNEKESGTILYCNHGFGASSLSWLPVLKRLTEHVGAKVGLAHDALGFGFSEPPAVEQDDVEDDPLYWYSADASAQVARTLLDDYRSPQDKVVLVGHSMGALTTLRLALSLPPEVPKRILLVAPALGIRKPPKEDESPRRTAGPLRKNIQSFFFERPAGYALKRAVGGKNFWRKGLRLAWGDSGRLKDADVLRFQWPSIHRGWETGLIRFARAQSAAFAKDELRFSTDDELLSRVLALPNTRVNVLVGGKDRVVPPSSARKFFAAFPSIHIEELPGLGHDPFEEDVEAFLRAID
jgi:pimeloyl-ACP methyl ester carboxylesterase